MRPEFEKMIDEVRLLLRESDGTVTEEANRLLDDAWNLIASDPRNRDVISLPITDIPDRLEFEELSATQTAIDREIVDMLNIKEREFESMANERPLTQEEIELKSKILAPRRNRDKQ
jgi:hypothetical protein